MNYCTLWFDGVWGHCCKAHDTAYSLQYDKFKADLELLQCVAETGHPIMGIIMFLGVSSFVGWYFYKRNK